jgi:plasmid maintenance system killer protein
MQITFRTKKLQKICSQAKEAVKKLGPPCAIKLQRRMMQLSAATCLAEIERFSPARCHELSGDRKGQLSVDLQHPYRLLFIPADEPAAEKEDGGIDWNAVKEIEIIEVEDTH